MRKLTVFASVTVLLGTMACNDTLPTATAPTTSPVPSANLRRLGSCTTLPALLLLIRDILQTRPANLLTIITKLRDFDTFVQRLQTPQAQAKALELVAYIRQLAASGRLPTAKANAFIAAILCYAGLTPDTHLVQPGDDPQTIVSTSGQSGLQIPGNDVTVPTLITITELDPNGPSGLITKLDKYPSFITITSSSPLMHPAVIAVCIPASLGVPADVFNRLRLGHQASTGFELTPPADPSFLGCTTTTSASSRTPGWLRTLASVFLPTKLYARTMTMATGGGVGGTSTEFSPFGAVDEGLFASGGGVGGTSTEFKVTKDALPNQPSSGTTKLNSKPSFSLYDVNGNCVSADTTVGLPLSPKCRPVVVVKTGKGTLLTGVPLSWAVTAGGGSIAPANLATDACGTFGASAANATDVNGKAGVCWTLGPNAGTNTVTATPSAGGDAPDGVVFLKASGDPEAGLQFTATGDLIPTTAGATGASVPYDGLQHPGSGTCSNSLTPAYSYNTVGGVVPVNAGSYTLTVTCGTGSTVYAVSTATAPISISQRAATATAGSATITFGATVPALPCVVGGLLAADAGTVTCTTSAPTHAPGANTTTPVVSPASPVNYAVTPVNGTLTVHYDVEECFEAGEGLFTSPPPTSSFQRRGVSVLAECELLDNTGHQVSGATGNITVLDMGTTGAGPGTLFLQANNAMSRANDTDGDDEYAYTISTSTMVSGHYYKVTVTWDDGSTEVGWMYVKQI